MMTADEVSEMSYGNLKTKKMMRIKLRDGRVVTNYTAGNLKGTCRTLDVSGGVISLGDGVCSRNGVAILDDSDTLVLKEDAEKAQGHR